MVEPAVEFTHRFSERITRFLFFAKELANNELMSDLLKKTSDSLIYSFIMSDLSESLTFALLSLATWAIRSRSLFRPERFAHSRSFDLSDLSDERIGEFPTLVHSAHTAFLWQCKAFTELGSGTLDNWGDNMASFRQRLCCPVAIYRTVHLVTM